MVTRQRKTILLLIAAVLCLLAVYPSFASAQQGPQDATILYLGVPGSVCRGTTGSEPSAPSTCDFYVNTTDGKLYMRWSTGAWVAAGSVYSVGNGTIGSLFVVSWSTATTTPALNLNFATQSANCLLAGPASGGAAVPTCRTMVLADVPDGLLTNAKVNASAGIAYSKLSLTGGIVNSDVNAAAAIAYAKLSLANSIVDGDIVSVTTRGKLPGAIAYDDEANTFTQPQGFSNGISSHLIPTLTDTYDFGSFDKLWKQGYLGQLNAVLFALETQTLFQGYLTVGHDAGTLGAAVSSGATTVNFGKTMTPGDFIIIRAQDTGGTYTNEYMTVGSNVSGTTYNVTRNLSGLGAKNWADGLPFLVLGQSGDGRIDMFAYDGKPRMVFTTQGASDNAQTVGGVVGNMNGYCGYVTDLVGLCAGNPSAAHITVDPTNGVRIRFGSTDKIVLAPGGSASFDGTITAAAGTIAGWTIDTAKLISASGYMILHSGGPNVSHIQVGDGGSQTAGINAAVNTTDITNWAGASHANRATAPWRVTLEGRMYASHAEITGGSMIVVNGGNTVGFNPAGTNAIYAGPTGAPTFTVTPGGLVTMTGAVVDGPQILLGTPNTAFLADAALRFRRSTGSGWGQTGDVWALWNTNSGVSGGTCAQCQTTVLDNSVVGGTGGGNTSAQANVVLRSRGWDVSGGAQRIGATLSLESIGGSGGSDAINARVGNGSGGDSNYYFSASALATSDDADLGASFDPWGTVYAENYRGGSAALTIRGTSGARIIGDSATAANFRFCADQCANGVDISDIRVPDGGGFHFYVNNFATLGAAVSVSGIYGETTASAANVFVDSNGLLQRSTSSARYKADIQPFTGGLADLLRLQPKSFLSKGERDGPRHLGFLAEDLDDAGLYSLVNYDAQGRPDAVQYDRLATYLVNAVQELAADLDTLRGRPTERVKSTPDSASREKAIGKEASAAFARQEERTQREAHHAREAIRVALTECEADNAVILQQGGRPVVCAKTSEEKSVLRSLRDAAEADSKKTIAACEKRNDKIVKQGGAPVVCVRIAA